MLKLINKLLIIILLCHWHSLGHIGLFLIIKMSFMKKFLIISTLATLITATQASAETTYTIKSNSTYSEAGIPSQCMNCIINIASNATLTIDKDIYLQNVAFNGGAILIDNKKMTFWSNGSFTNVTVSFKSGANLVNSGALTISGSAFTFSGNAYATVYTSIALSNSSWKFLDNAYMESTGGTFSLSASSLSAGDGSTTSKAYIRFNGGTLNELDNISFVTLGGTNNYYFNWSNYSANGRSIKTTDNKQNCGTPGANACSSPVLYGPATLTSGGYSSAAMLPVKLSAFSVRLSGTNAILSWTTDQEMNSSRFEIEKSTDGIKWTSIGSVAAQGNTTNATSYTFTDAAISGATVSYRLKMIDLDEAFEYSSIRSVKPAAATTREMTIYPNPATDYVVISSKGAVAQNVTIQLIGMNGQVLKQINGNGSNTTLQVNGFHAGNYIVRVADATGNAQSFKLLIAK